MFAAFAAEIATLATTAVGSGGMGFANASDTLYSELPGTPTTAAPGDGLPALCVGPGSITGPVTRSKTGTGTVLRAPLLITVLLATHHGEGRAQSDADAIRMVATLEANGYRLTRIAQTEDDWMGRSLFLVSAGFSRDAEFDLTP